jgi:thiol-disulfide isomerase/thioredoxin
MKKIFFVFILITLTIFVTQAQNTHTINRRIKANENSIVKDSSGNIYEYAIWSSLIKSRDYILVLIDSAEEKKVFLLKRLNDAEKLKRDMKYPKPLPSKFFTDGEKISSFRTTDINGNRVVLKDLIGKIVVLNFWFINCPPCRAEIPTLNGIRNQYQGNNDIVFLAVCLDEKFRINEFMKDLPFYYTQLDNGGFIASKYGIHLFPTHVVLDKEGKVRFHTSGSSIGTSIWLKLTIDELLSKN